MENELPPGRYYWRLDARDERGASASSATWSFQVPQRSAPVEAVVGTYFDGDGDGRDDVVAAIGARFALLYGAAGGAESWERLSLRAEIAASAGDLDGDGLSEAGTSGDCSVPGSCTRLAAVRRGSVDRASIETLALDAEVSTAQSIVAAGDVDRDGFGDAIVVTREGMFVAHGSAQGLMRRSPARSIAGVNAVFFTTAAAGDVDGDGFADVIAAGSFVEGQRSPAFVRVYFGSREGISETSATTLTLDGLGGFGPAVAGAGDLNGDGYADVVIGAVASAQGSGGLWVAYGGSRATALSRRQFAGASERDARYGNLVRGVGDVDGDGFDEVVTTSGPIWGSPGEDSAMLVFRGGRDGITLGARVLAPRDFGHGIAGPVDVNGDGLFDIAGNVIDSGAGGSVGMLLFDGRSGAMPIATPRVKPFGGAPESMSGPIG